MIQLPSGKVLAVSWSTDRLSPPGTHLYDPTVGPNGSWLPGPPLNLPTGENWGVTTALLSGAPSQCGDNCGKVLALIGGFTPKDGVWKLYEPAAGPVGRWTDVNSPAGAKPLGRAAFRTAAVQVTGTNCAPHCGKVLILGQKMAGWPPSPSPAVAELYDPKTNGFAAIDARYAPDGDFVEDVELAPLRDGRVLLVGVKVTDQPVGPDLREPWAKLFHPGTATFTDADTPGRFHNRLRNPLEVLPDGSVLGIGSDGAEIYRPDESVGSWEQVPSCGSSEKDCFILASLADGTVLANGNAGGDRLANGSTDIFLFDPGTKVWRQTGSVRSGNTPGAGVLLGLGACPGPQCHKVLAAGDSSSELYAPPSG